MLQISPITTQFHFLVSSHHGVVVNISYLPIEIKVRDQIRQNGLIAFSCLPKHQQKPLLHTCNIKLEETETGWLNPDQLQVLSVHDEH